MTTAVAPADASVFLGILSAGKPASPPFVFSPNFTTLGPSGATIVFTISVKNLTSEPQAVTLNFGVHHILTYYGLNVADGQPGQPGITFKPGDAPNTTQQLVGTPQLVTVTFPPAAAGPTTLTFQQTVNMSGYFQVDVGQHKGLNKPHANLSSGFTRLLKHERAQPSIRTTPNPKSATVGATLKDSATLSGGQSPTGTITFTLYDPKHAVAHTEAVHVTAGNGTYSTSTGHVAGAAGTWHWKATYSGDANNNSATSIAADEPVIVTKEHERAQPSISTTPNPTSATVGATLKDSATLSGGHSPTGTITFTLYDPNDAVAYTEAVHVTAGNGTYSTSTGHVAGAAGTWHWKAEYNGDVNNMPVASNAADEPVIVTEEHQRAQPSISTTPNPTSATVGATLKDSATLSGGQSPTGTITFTLYDPNDAVAHTETVQVTAGNGAYSTSTGHVAGTAGTWHWKAEYSGDANNMPVASNAADEPVTVIPTGGAGGVLADTGSTPPAEVLALLLVGFGALAIMMSVAWRRRQS